MTPFTPQDFPETFLKAYLRERLARITNEGCLRTALFPAGQHTKWLLTENKTCLHPGNTVVFDDNVPAKGKVINGFQVLSTSLVAKTKFNIGIISSDTPSKALVARARFLFKRKTQFLYEGLPPGPYSEKRTGNLDTLPCKQFKRKTGKRRIPANLSVCIFTTGEPLLAQCRKALAAQTLQPRYVETIENVFPMDKAFQTGLSKIKTPYYVSVDADMILYPSCLEFLYNAIRKDPKAFEAIARLQDPYLGPIDGVRIYRTDIVRKLGGIAQVRGPERKLALAAAASGYNRLHFRTIVGLHHPEYTVKEAFWKFKNETEKIRLHSGGDMKLWINRLNAVIRRYQQTLSEDSIAAICGLMIGTTTPASEILSELDASKYETNSQFAKFKTFLHNRRHYVLKPESLHHDPKRLSRLRKTISTHNIRKVYIYGTDNNAFALAFILEEVLGLELLGFLCSRPTDKHICPPALSINKADLTKADAIFLPKCGDLCPAREKSKLKIAPCLVLTDY